MHRSHPQPQYWGSHSWPQGPLYQPQRPHPWLSKLPVLRSPGSLRSTQQPPPTAGARGEETLLTTAEQRLVGSTDVPQTSSGGRSRHGTSPGGTLGRWWIYQRERFPLLTHGLLIAVFSFSTISFSAMARGSIHLPSLKAYVVAFASALLFFLQLRIADEFKDAEEDARFRPYRPVPRGLVSLRELGAVGVAAGVAQAGLALWLSPALLPLLLLVWGYLALMSKEFFVRRWLKARPVTYIWTHMLILPLIDLYGTACDWRVAGVAPPSGLIWLLAVSFCDGFVLEIGRKIRAPGDEERGVETYSFLWGRRRAVAVWLGVLLVTAASAWVAAAQIQFAGQAAAILAILLVVAATLALRFLRAPVTTRARWIEHMSGLWTLLMYLSLGALPLALALAWKL